MIPGFGSTGPSDLSFATIYHRPRRLNAAHVHPRRKNSSDVQRGDSQLSTVASRKLNYPFQTSGDTETLLAQYQDSGLDGVKRLRGQFAYAVYDERTGELHLVRDRLGILPLYYISTDRFFAFASEIKGLFPVMDVVRVDRDSLYDYLAHRWRPDVFEAFAALRSQLTTKSALSKREQAVMVCAMAAELGDSYCSLAWGRVLAQEADAASAAALLGAGSTDRLNIREQALAAWSRKLVADPNETSAQDVDALRAAGLSEKEVFEATVFIAFRLAFSTVNDALGVEPDPQLVESTPKEVTAAVAFGRPAARSSAPTNSLGTGSSFGRASRPTINARAQPPLRSRFLHRRASEL